MNPAAETLFQDLWQQYVAITPQVQEIHAAFVAAGETVKNDHVAFRSLDFAGFDTNTMAKDFEALGYKIRGDYVFEQKKLQAIHLEGPDSSYPKVFISHLETAKISETARSILKKHMQYLELKPGVPLCLQGRAWMPSKEDYEALLAESEYAAWFLAFGFCVNHFTVSINALKNFESVSDVNEFLKAKGFKLNSSGGEIKGGPDVHLEQSSTLAGQVEVDFAEGRSVIPSCYYEFAKRYPMKDGNLYQGFVAKSADKIFESTDSQD